MATEEVHLSGKRYPEEFKIEAVRQVVDRGYPVVEVASRLGVTTHSLYAWLRRYGPDKDKAAAEDEAHKEIRRLQEQLRRVTEERDILKKAARYFANNPE